MPGHMDSAGVQAGPQRCFLAVRRIKVTLIYRRPKHLRVVRLLLGHTILDSTVRYLGIEIDDAPEMSEQIDV